MTHTCIDIVIVTYYVSGMRTTNRQARSGNPLVAVAYLRVSTDEQKLGPEAQRAAIETWAKREGVSVVAWHCDSGISGGSDLADRPGLVAAIGELRAAGAGVLAIARRDRLARDVGVAAAVERAVKGCGAKVLSADGTANGDSAADAFMRTILDAASEYERALLRARTKAALAAKRAKGERTGECPYGYRAGSDGKLIPHEGEQKIIALVRDHRAAGMSLRAIVAELARAGFVSRSGKPYALTQVVGLARAA
mgnify:CR=1 FL=1